jgi:hypothetical protein
MRHEALLLAGRSAVCLLVGAALVYLSSRPETRKRAIEAAAVLAVFFAAAFAIRLEPVPFIIFMGDYGQYQESAEQLTRYFIGEDLRFDAHLASLVMRAIIASGLAARDDPQQAFVVLAVLATIAWVAALVAVVVGDRMSAWSLRYVGLLAAAPAAVLFFGYREIAYLPLVALAVGWPLVVRGSRTGSRRDLALGATAIGAAVGLHGYAAMGLLSLFLFVVIAAGSRRTALARGADAIAFGTLGWVGAIPLEIIFLNLNVLPHHAGDIPWRPLFHRRWEADEHRYAEAILSPVGVRDTVVSLILVGAPLLIAALLALRRTRRLEAIAVSAATLPAAVWLIANWTVQGIGVDTDSIIGLFPVLPLLAVGAAATLRTSVLGLGLLAVGHVALWAVLLYRGFHSFQVDM